MDKFTPGPWNCRKTGTWPDTNHDLGIYADSAVMPQVAKVEGFGYVSEANAKLIAAAPDLLAVVREACEIFDLNREGDEFNSDLASDLWKNEIHEKLTAAITKATT